MAKHSTSFPSGRSYKEILDDMKQDQEKTLKKIQGENKLVQELKDAQVPSLIPGASLAPKQDLSPWIQNPKALEKGQAQFIRNPDFVDPVLDQPPKSDLKYAQPTQIVQGKIIAPAQIEKIVKDREQSIREGKTFFGVGGEDESVKKLNKDKVAVENAIPIQPVPEMVRPNVFSTYLVKKREEPKKVTKQEFIDIEKKYFQQIDDIIANLDNWKEGDPLPSFPERPNALFEDPNDPVIINRQRIKERSKQLNLNIDHPLDYDYWASRITGLENSLNEIEKDTTENGGLIGFYRWAYNMGMSRSDIEKQTNPKYAEGNIYDTYLKSREEPPSAPGKRTQKNWLQRIQQSPFSEDTSTWTFKEDDWVPPTTEKNIEQALPEVLPTKDQQPLVSPIIEPTIEPVEFDWNKEYQRFTTHIGASPENLYSTGWLARQRKLLPETIGNDFKLFKDAQAFLISLGLPAEEYNKRSDILVKNAQLVADMTLQVENGEYNFSDIKTNNNMLKVFRMLSIDPNKPARLINEDFTIDESDYTPIERMLGTFTYMPTNSGDPSAGDTTLMKQSFPDLNEKQVASLSKQLDRIWDLSYITVIDRRNNKTTEISYTDYKTTWVKETEIIISRLDLARTTTYTQPNATYRAIDVNKEIYLGFERTINTPYRLIAEVEKALQKNNNIWTQDLLDRMETALKILHKDPEDIALEISQQVIQRNQRIIQSNINKKFNL